MEDEVVQKKSNQYKCPSCGGNMEFSSQTGHLICPHCGGNKEVFRNKDVRERDFSEMEAPRWDNAQVQSYRCKNCGAETVLNKTDIATLCPFCGSAVVLDTAAIASVKPNTVIPFEVAQDKAKKALLTWRKRRLLAPNKFQKIIAVDEMQGVYHPMWTFDSCTVTQYAGRLGKTRTRTVGSGKNRRTETYIEWFRVSGIMRNIFDDILIPGAKNIEEKYLKKIEPFPQEKYCVYSDEFLAGFIASNYTVKPQDAFEIAQIRMREIVLASIKDKYHADHVDSAFRMDMAFESRSFKYLMLPIYIAATRFNKKLYNQYVSGVFTVKGKDRQNVKVSGKSPLSPIKVALVTIAGLLLVGGLVFLYMLYGEDSTLLYNLPQLLPKYI